MGWELSRSSRPWLTSRKGEDSVQRFLLRGLLPLPVVIGHLLEVKLTNAASIGLRDGYNVILDRHLFALLREMAKQVRDISAHCADIGNLHLDIGQVSQLIKPHPAVHRTLM